MGKFCNFWTELSARDMSTFSFPHDNFSKYQRIFTKLGVCIDIAKIWFGIAHGQISTIFDSYLPATHPYFHFWTITLVNINGFSPNLVCAFYIVKICIGIANGQSLSIFDRVICPQYICIILSGQ